PVGPASTHPHALRGFAAFCAGHGWTPCLYAITEATRDLATGLGWYAIQVAEEASVSLPGLRFAGRKWQNIRTAFNNAAKRGITTEWISYPEAPYAVVDQIRAISDEWVADKGVPEMGFTLGGLAELADDQVRCLLAVDANRTIHAITSWLPVYRD